MSASSFYQSPLMTGTKREPIGRDDSLDDDILARSEAGSIASIQSANNIEQLLEYTKVWRPYPMFITCSMAFLWSLCALSAISPAFTAEPCEDNCTFYTIHRDFNLTDYAIDPAELTSSAYFFGNFLIGQAFATLADRFGRRPVIIASLLLTGISGSLGAAAPSFGLLLLARIVQGSCFTPLTTVNYVLSGESIPARAHSLVSMFFGISWVAGYCFLAPMALWFPHWRTLQLATSVPCIAVAVILYLTLPESVAYSIQHNDETSVKKWIRMNELLSCRQISHNLDEIMKSKHYHDIDYNDQDRSIWKILKDIRRDRKIMRTMCTETIIWTLTFMNYCALSLTSTSVGDSNPIVSFIFSGVVELPAYICIPIALRWCQRKPSRVVCHSLGILAMVAMYFQDFESSFYLPIWLLGKFSASCCYILCFIYASELFPVHCRTCCIGVCSTFCNIGAIVAPYIFAMENIQQSSQFLLIALSNILCVSLAFAQPETKPSQ